MKFSNCTLHVFNLPIQVWVFKNLLISGNFFYKDVYLPFLNKVQITWKGKGRQPPSNAVQCFMLYTVCVMLNLSLNQSKTFLTFNIFVQLKMNGYDGSWKQFFLRKTQKDTGLYLRSHAYFKWLQSLVCQ